MMALALVIGCRKGRQLTPDDVDSSTATLPDASSVDLAPSGAGGSLPDGATDVTGLTDASSSDRRGPAMLVLDRTTYDFGMVVVGATSAAQAFLVTNTGGTSAGTTAPLAVMLGGNGPSDFIVTTNSCAGLTPFTTGSTCGFDVAFKPTSAGAKSATVTVTANPGGTAAASLTGTVATPATLVLAPVAGSSPNFGVQNVGQSTAEDFLVTNTGQLPSSPIVVTLMTSAGSGFSLADPSLGDCVSGVTTLAPGASCNIEARFTPTAVGGAAATLSVGATMGGTPTPLQLTATGNRLVYFVSSVTMIDLGALPIGTQGAGSVTFTNMGSRATGVPTVSADMVPNLGKNVIVGAIANNGCVASLAVGESCTVSFTFIASMRGGQFGNVTIAATPGGMTQVLVSVTGL